MTAFAAIAFVLLAIGSVCFLTRLFRGPSITDRVIALDGLWSPSSAAS
jgi:multisubunit Na+/H+ antiporter MnhF subunit